MNLSRGWWGGVVGALRVRRGGGGGVTYMFAKVFLCDLPHITTPPRKVVF